MNDSFKAKPRVRSLLIGLLLVGLILSLWTATARDECGFCTANLPAAATANILGGGALALGIGFVAIGMVAGNMDEKRPKTVLLILIIGAIAAIIALFALKNRPYVEEGGISGTVAATSIAVIFLYIAFLWLLMTKDQKPASAPAPAAKAAPAVLPAHEEDQHVLLIEGIGTKYASRLNYNGIITQPQLIRADARAVAKHAQCTVDLAEEWQGEARLMQVKGIGPQFAEILALAGLRTVEELAASDPVALLAKVDAIEERRKVRVLKTDVKLHHIQKFVDAAKAHL